MGLCCTSRASYCCRLSNMEGSRFITIIKIMNMNKAYSEKNKYRVIAHSGDTNYYCDEYSEYGGRIVLIDGITKKEVTIVGEYIIIEL